MRILLISRAFYPILSARSFRTTELAKEFARMGHEVVVYTPPTDFDYSLFYKEHPNITIKFTRDITKSFFFHNSIFSKHLYSPLYWLIYYPYIHYLWDLEDTLKNEKDYDLLISLAIPHSIHWGINRIYRKRKIAKTWIADCGDPFMKIGTGRRPLFYFKWIEKAWCRKCDYITVPTATSHFGYYEEFWNKIKVIPQAFNLEQTPIDDYKSNEVPTFCYAGGVMKGIRDPQLFLEYLCKLDRPFKFVVYGGVSKNYFTPFKKVLGEKLELRDDVDRPTLIKIISRMDFLINIGNGTNIQTPSKLIDYTIAKRPILTIETNDIKENILNEFLDGNYDHKDPVIDISRYDIHKVAQQFLDLCK